MVCIACNQKPALFGKERSKPILCLDCYSKWQQTEAYNRQAESQKLSTLLSTMKYAENMIAEQMGFSRPNISPSSVNNFNSRHYHVENSQVGMINEGVIYAKDIKNEIQIRNDDINASLNKLYEAIVASREILEQQRQELFELVSYLLEEAKKPRVERRTSIIRNALTTIRDIASSYEALKVVWDTISPFIISHFS